MSAFTHLGCYLTSNNNGTEQVQCRISADKAADFPLVLLLKTNKKKSHTREHKALIRPVVLYASNTWTLSQRAAQMIGSFERNILRRIYGPAQINGVKKCRDCIKRSFWTYCSRTTCGSRGIRNVSWNNHFQWLLYNIHVYHFIKSL